MSKKLNRRTLLRGIGGAAIGLPFLEAMLSPGRSRAQEGEIPRRVVFFFTGNGPNREQWWPSGGETDFTLGPSHAALEPFRSKLIIPANISMVTAEEARGDGGNGHDVGCGHCLTARSIVAGPDGVGQFGHLWDGTAGGISVDQAIADALAGRTLFRSLEVGAKAEGIRQALPSRISYRGQGQPVTPFHTPGETFDTIFAPLSGEEREVNPSSIRRAAVLGAVHSDLNRLERRLGRADRERLGLHIQSIEEIAARIDTSTEFVCETSGRTDSNEFPEMVELQIDMIVQALKCDLTRVASIQCSTGQSGIQHEWLGHDDYHHSISHQGASNEEAARQVAQIDDWYAQRFARLLAGLEAVVVGDGQTLLDYTTVVWVSEQGKGTGNSHVKDQMPYVLAGSGGGYFHTGRYIDTGGRAHGELFLSLMHMMGLDDTHFGIREYCDGPITSLRA